MMLRRALSSSAALKRTPLYDLHVSLGGTIVDFAGWELPVQYSNLSITDSCIHTRTNASLFDVSHMQQLRFHGKDRVAFLERVTVSSISALKPAQGRYTLLTNSNGGIVDDLIVTNVPDKDAHYVVVNAACADKDIKHFNAQLESFKSDNPDKKDVQLEIINDRALIALQGPKAVNALNTLLGGAVDLSQVGFFYSFAAKVAEAEVEVSRSGYTGEDGFEISIPSKYAVEVTEKLLKSNPGVVEVAGLGARDVLRLEAGLCLYGNDMDEKTTPVEAGLVWTISPKRRAAGGFVGDKVILQQLKDGPSKKRVGLLCTGPPARSHSGIADLSGNSIGEVCSGTFSPILKKPIAMGYVETKYAAEGTEIQTVVRNKHHKAVVAPLPFVPTKYFSISKK
eukprot:TRINITY_DN3581_c0_g1_i1.p1 TRINITY_DN3581_c0_g1~~TRINITY_DN3581_c0_g1_i1.p1  ORF type:complete len:395 (-),score=131.52 TRINITY_DN3581_c0_g1_i1:44-1228(-)